MLEKVKRKLNAMSMRWRILLLGTLIVVGMIVSQIFYFFFDISALFSNGAVDANNEV